MIIHTSEPAPLTTLDSAQAPVAADAMSVPVGAAPGATGAVASHANGASAPLATSVARKSAQSPARLPAAEAGGYQQSGPDKLLEAMEAVALQQRYQANGSCGGPVWNCLKLRGWRDRNFASPSSQAACCATGTLLPPDKCTISAGAAYPICRIVCGETPRCPNPAHPEPRRPAARLVCRCRRPGAG